MKKFLFIHTPAVSVGKIFKNKKSITSSFMYGILSIVTYAKSYASKDVEFKILDFNTKERIEYDYKRIENQVEKEILEFKPDIIGLAAFYDHSIESVKEIADFVKNLNKDILIVCGGSAVTANYKNILLNIPSLDAICYSEGEIPILDLIDADDMNEVLLNHPSWITLDRIKEVNDKVYPAASFIENLDEIPPIDYSLIKFDDYDLSNGVFLPNDVNNVKNDIILPIATTRGCPFNCVFCVAGSLHGRKIRMMSAERVISDVKELRDKYGMKGLYILDDQFLLKKEHAKQILKGLANLNITLIADCGFTVSYVDDEIAKLLLKCGLKTARLAVESGSPYVLKKIIDKPINLENIQLATNSFRKYGIFTSAFMVIGIPGETKDHLRESVEYYKKVGFDWVFITCATPFKGSRLYDICKKNGYMDEKKSVENPIYASAITTKDFTAEYITEQAYLINLELNFVYSTLIKNKNYMIAKERYEDIVKRFPDHAFAYYCLQKVYEGLNYDKEKVEQAMNKFIEIVTNNEQWNRYAKIFDLI